MSDVLSGRGLQLGAGLLSEAKVGSESESASSALLVKLEPYLPQASVNYSFVVCSYGTRQQTHDISEYNF